METPPKPIRGNVILMPLADEAISSGGIILLAPPDRKSPPRGLVMAIGPQVDEVAEGDEVWFNQHAVKLIDVNGAEFIVINVHDVLAKITRNDERGDTGAES